MQIGNGYGLQVGKDIAIGRIPGPRLTGANPWYLNNTSLASSLVAFWPLDEASGNRLDRKGSSTLADNNTVTSAAGHTYPLAAEFVIANSEFLSAADSATLSSGNIDLWGACWVYPSAVNVSTCIVGKWHTTGNREWQLAQSNANVVFQVSPDGTSTGNGAVTATNALTANTWTLVVFYHDATNNLLGISVDGGAFTTAAHTTGIFDSAAAFNIGRQASAAAYFGGRIQSVALGKGYIPTQADAGFFLTMA